MKALVTNPNEQAPLTLAEVAPPTASPQQAVVEVKATSINRGELALLRARPNAWRPGQDLAGIVVAAAQDGSGPKAGTRVAGFAEQGSWAERIAIEPARLGPLPDGVTYEQAATLPAAAMTALRVLRFGGLLYGRHVLITGAAGVVGRFAVEIAGGSGAIVTALIKPGEDAASLTAFGNTKVVADLGQLEGPFDLIIESIGGEVLDKALATVAPGGTIVPFGNVSGQSSHYNAFAFVGHEGARIQSFLSYAAGPVEQIGMDLALLAKQIVAGQLHPDIGLSLPWTEANRGVAALKDGSVHGKVVLRMSEA